LHPETEEIPDEALDEGPSEMFHFIKNMEKLI